VLRIDARLRTPAGGAAPVAVALELSGHGAALRQQLALEPDGEAIRARGELTVGEVQLWWPHTHGDPDLYNVTLVVGAGADEQTVDLGRVGFRSLDCGTELERDGIQLTLNGVSVFARGAVWTPLDLALPHSPEPELRRVLGTVAAGGMNMVRLPGIGCYESDSFYELCDELGILVWQDFMFANLDYPEQDERFMATVEAEVRSVLARLGGRPSLAVLCGGSEVAQQVAMLGLDPALASGPLFGELLPAIVAEAELDAAYVPSTPWGGELPFRPNRGVAHYYGVGAYLRPLEDVRRSAVKFAAECLAFSNVPDDDALEAIDAPGGVAVHHPRWKQGVPRDAGAGWDFEDVRDHYMRLLFDRDPVALRGVEHERYLELSRAVTGEVMAEVFGEWRRAQSPCGGALVLWLTDLLPGAGWGILDHRGEPKVAFAHLRRALAPVAVWSTDEGLGGVDVHVANDRPSSLRANLRFALYRDLEVRVEEHVHELRLEPHSAFTDNLEGLLGRFVDVAWAYRFGPPAHDLIVISLEQLGGEGTTLLSQTFRLPAGRPIGTEPPDRLGVDARVRALTGSTATITLSARRFVYGVRLHVPGFRALDDSFSLEPGREREVSLIAASEAAEFGRGTLTALNLAGRVAIEPEPAE
jgi:beta-mannosidase